MAKTKQAQSKKSGTPKGSGRPAGTCLDDLSIDELRERLAALMDECDSPAQLLRMVEAVEQIAEEEN